MADHSVGAWNEVHESEASQASVFCFDNAFLQKSCLFVDLVCFFSLCLRVAVFLNATRSDRRVHCLPLREKVDQCNSLRRGRSSLHTSLVAHQAVAYQGFRNMKHGGLPPAVNSPALIYAPGQNALRRSVPSDPESRSNAPPPPTEKYCNLKSPSSISFRMVRP